MHFYKEHSPHLFSSSRSVRLSVAATWSAVKVFRSSYPYSHPSLLVVWLACGSLRAAGCHGLCIPDCSVDVNLHTTSHAVVFLAIRTIDHPKHHCLFQSANKNTRHPLCSAVAKPRILRLSPFYIGRFRIPAESLHTFHSSPSLNSQDGSRRSVQPYSAIAPFSFSLLHPHFRLLLLKVAPAFSFSNAGSGLFFLFDYSLFSSNNHQNYYDQISI